MGSSEWWPKVFYQLIENLEEPNELESAEFGAGPSPVCGRLAAFPVGKEKMQ